MVGTIDYAGQVNTQLVAERQAYTDCVVVIHMPTASSEL